MDLLRDPIWEFMGVMLPVIIILAQRKLKGLSYHVVEDTTIVKVDEHIAPRVQTLLDGKPVGEVRRVTVRLINVGHLDVNTKDYEVPIEIELGKCAQILEAKVGEVRPRNLQPVVKTTANGVLLEPMMLQSGEYVTITVLAANSHQPVAVLSQNCRRKRDHQLST